MKLLLDANVLWRLAAHLQPYFSYCLQVDHIGLSVPAKDIEIWNYALAKECIIVTNDEDFLNLLNIKGYPPKLILLKTGNQSNNYIEALLIKHKEDIHSLNVSKEYGVLELF
jgi:predicted nuclease of predicted toxin-antitoxin system